MGKKEKCKMLLFSCSFFFSFLGSVLYVFFLFFFLSVLKCHIVLYECLCFNLFVVCQNEDLKHVAGIVTRNEKKKKLTKNDSLCICVMGEGGCIWGDFRESRTEGCKASRF